MPPDLPKFTVIEEMLIARVYDFLRDSIRNYHKLPNLPRDADVVLLRPSDRQDPAIRKPSNREITVRRHVVRGVA